jgi:hypothetical protein
MGEHRTLQREVMLLEDGERRGTPGRVTTIVEAPPLLDPVPDAFGQLRRPGRTLRDRAG